MGCLFIFGINMYKMKGVFFFWRKCVLKKMKDGWIILVFLVSVVIEIKWDGFR